MQNIYSKRHLLSSRKKAFTLTEMLVCVLCLGILTAAITAFYVAVNSQALAINTQKQKMLYEYSDITTLTNKNSDVENEIANLYNSEYLIKAGQVAIGTPQIPQHGLTVGANQTVVFESNDATIAAYSESLGVVGVAPGVTYLTATIYIQETDGSLTKTDVFRIIPVHVYSPSDTLSGLIQYYYYNGMYLNAWISEPVIPAGGGA